MLLGLVLAIAMQSRRCQNGSEHNAAARRRPDLALFSATTMLCGTAGNIGFLLWLKYPTQPWYYVELLVLWAISLDALLGAPWPTLRLAGWARAGFLAVMLASRAASVWEEAHTRRSNVDLIAATLAEKAAPADLIVIQGVWEGITFDRYYHGAARWMTLPPVDSHQVHRNDLVREKLEERDPLAPVLRETTRALQDGNRVWVAGKVRTTLPERWPPNQPATLALGPRLDYWRWQVTAHLLGQGAQPHPVRLPDCGLVSHYEDLPLVRFSRDAPGPTGDRPQ